MSTAASCTSAPGYSVGIEKSKKNQIMDTHKTCDVIPLFPGQEDDSEIAGWDPYIFSIVAGHDRYFGEERRRMSRPLTPSRRRALLLASRKIKKKKLR